MQWISRLAEEMLMYLWGLYSIKIVVNFSLPPWVINCVCQALIIKTQVQSQNTPCGIYGRKSDMGAGFFPSVFSVPVHIFQQCSTFIHHFIQSSQTLYNSSNCEHNCNCKHNSIKHTSHTHAALLSPLWSPSYLLMATNYEPPQHIIYSIILSSLSGPCILVNILSSNLLSFFGGWAGGGGYTNFPRILGPPSNSRHLKANTMQIL